MSDQKVLSQATLQEKWQRDRNDWDALSKESWFLKQDEEPLNHLGKSILVRWLYPLEDKEQKGWRCGVPKDGESWCRKEIARIDRAIIHVRSDLGLEPYPCEGHCNIPNCPARFASREYRADHYKGPDLKWCELCGTEVARRNLGPHKARCSKWLDEQAAEGSREEACLNEPDEQAAEGSSASVLE